jgi:hypothetical protein
MPRRLLVSPGFVIAVWTLGAAASLGAQSAAPPRNATPAALCSRNRAIGLGAGAALGGAAALVNFWTTTLGLFTVPQSGSAPTRATLAGALFGAGAGLLQADASESCRRTDGAVPETVSPSTRLIEPGIRVRVRAAAFGPEPVTRVVVGRRADTLVLAPDRGGPASHAASVVALDDIARLDIARVHGLRATRPLLVGGLLGAAVGGVVGYNQALRKRSCFIVCDATPMEETYFGAFDGLVAGAAVGLFAERGLSNPQWARVPLNRSGEGDGRLGVRIVPARGGVTLAVTVH